MSEFSEIEEIVADGQSHSVEYVGTVGALFPIALMNLFLTIITLGIYRFWAKTNVRKYLWSQTHLDGEPFEYTGTGGELFMGFLIVFFIFILPLMIGLGLLTNYYPMIAQYGIFALYPFFIFLMGVALYRAQVYQMSRTQWRGIRGAQLPGSKAYGWLTLKYAVLYLITFGIIVPYVVCKMWNFMMNNKRLGSGVFKCNVSSKPLFKTWFICLGMIIVLIAGVSSFFLEAATTNNTTMFLASYFISLIGFIVIFSYFQAKSISHLISGLEFQSLKFEFELGIFEYITFSLVNVLLILFTLGFAAPFIVQRWVRLFAQKIKLKGQVDFSEISQAPETGPRFGEGLVEAFDM